MRTVALAFAFGVLLLQILPSLPSRSKLGFLTLALLAAVWVAGRLAGNRRFVLLILLAAGAGFIYAGWRAVERSGDALPVALERRDIEITGVVHGLPQYFDGAVRFLLEVKSARHQDRSVELPARIQLSWYPSRDSSQAIPAVAPGQYWQLQVRLKRPHGLVNPHGFDYEAWLLEHGIRATGYVRESDVNRLLDDSAAGILHSVNRWRAAVRNRFAVTLAEQGENNHVGLLTALVVGDQRSIPLAQWEVFRRTATAHLVSISGLHVSMVALLAGLVAAGVWRRFPALMLRVASRRVAVCAGLLAATGYGMLAGFGIPVQRALIMLAVGALALMSGRETNFSGVLILALLGVLLVDPWAVLSAGFWLSFGAVAVIGWVVAGRMQTRGKWVSAVHIQLSITLATMPLLLQLFHAFSLVSPLANAIAIPLVSFVITPLSLLAMVLPLPELLQLANWAAGVLMHCLETLAWLPVALWQQAAAPLLLVLLAVVSAAWLLLPRGTPCRAAAWLGLMPLLSWSPPRPEPGMFTMTVLDVGHGTAVHVQTARHDLLYDAGPVYGPASDAGQRVLLPYFVAAGVSRLDTLVLSHGDIDHIGGAPSLLASLPTGTLLASLPPEHALWKAGVKEGTVCEKGMTWSWDGVDFEVLHPAETLRNAKRENDRSCVLRIASGGGVVLLTGDIEKTSEKRLVKQMPEKLASDVAVVSHHGSASSSSPAFIAVSGARHAVYSLGYRNAFRHPHPTVTERWEDAGAQTWRTDLDGAILIRVGTEGMEIAAQRDVTPHYWYDRFDR